MFKTRFFKLNLLICGFLLFGVFLIQPQIKAQNYLDENAVKCNLIVRLIEYFNWPRENTMQKIVIAVFDDETELYPYLQSLVGRKKIKGKLVEIKKIKSPAELSNTNVFYIDPERSKSASRYYESIKGKNILFITDQSETTEGTMINLVVTRDNKLSFELNKKNLENNKFNVPNDLLVLGGSQLDIKAVFDETQRNLQSIQEKVKKQQSEIESQKKIIASQLIEVENQKQTISRQNEEITTQREIYRKLKTSVDSTSSVLLSETAKIQEQKNNISLRDEIIKKQESRINDQLSILAKQLTEIEEGKQKIENQKEDLKKQGSQINTQRNIISISAAFLVVLTILTIIILRINRMNKKINRQLTEKNSQIEKQKLDLENQKRQLEISNSELENFSYSVSHDLRAPLRIIDGYSNIMLNEYGDNLDKDAKEFLSKIIASSKKMAILIDDLLRLAKITRQSLVREHINFSLTVKNIIDELLSNDPQRAIEIKLEENIFTDGDSRLLKIALQNIIDNAFKFTSKIENPIIEIGVMKQGEKDIFFIKDNGAGFDMNNAGRLFQAFQRLHENSEFPGTGIGLTIVQRIIQRHGGNIWMEAQPGKGTTVFFALS